MHKRVPLSAVAKPSPLAALQSVQAAGGAGVAAPLERPAPEVPKAPRRSATAPRAGTGRAGLTNITGYFPMPVKDSLRMCQIKTRKNFQELLEEALTDLFRKHNVPVPRVSEQDN